jgi:hypothetical protein
MKEFLQAIANSSIEQQVSLLPQALDYGDLGIDFLIDRLDDPELEIRAKAYQLLQHNQSQKVQQAIAPGLLINPGDKIYYIQESTMWFDDYGYWLSAKEDSVKHLETQDDYRNQDYKIVRYDQEVYVISYVPYYTNYQLIKSLVTSLQKERILEHSITIFDLENDHKAIEQWCNLHKITEEVSKLQKERNLEFEIEFDRMFSEIRGEHVNRFVIYWSTVEEYLKSTENLGLLNQLWQDSVGSLVSICEVNFARKNYLTIDVYYSQILDQTNSYTHYAGEDRDEFFGDNLISEKAETRFLLKTLHYSNIAIRSLVYQLLKGVELDNAQQAINLGLKLNSGDTIYSVYQSGLGYTDEWYCVLCDDVDYIEQLDYQITNIYKDDPRGYSQRRYCFADKKQAEAAAETLHRKLIKERNFTLEWRKENPDFNLKKWCIDNDIAYEDESYHSIFEIKELIADDDQLYDNLRRSRYIYHPKIMDTWCRDNNICYEQICDDNPPDDWHNYGKVLDYINQPSVQDKK